MKTLEKKIRESIKHFEKQFRESAEIKEFEKTSQKFNTLVKEGFVKKRGNNLLSISDRHLIGQVIFNA